jgi:energy-coupling factor transporter ATP-binding protein EcfA2
MAPLPPDLATTLKQGFQVCDVGHLEGEALERYYVDLAPVRSMEAMRSISTQLEFLEPGEFDTLLFTGHRGCGKSTELQRLRQLWERDYRVIYLEVDTKLDVNDLDYTDLYLLIIKEIADEMAKLELEFEPSLMRAFERWFMEITAETEETIEKSVSLATQAEVGWEIPFISKLLAKLLAQIRGATQHKTTLREKLQRDVGKLKADLNNLLQDGFAKLTARFADEGLYQRGFLVIFDNLDRVPPEVGDRLYFNHGTYLRELSCTLIYTVPISVVYSNKNLNHVFGRSDIVPMVNIYQGTSQSITGSSWQLACDLKRVKRLAGLVAKRVDVRALFVSPQLVLRLAQASGGHVRQLMQMTATACLTAAARRHGQVESEDVDYAIKQGMANFERIISAEDYGVLAQAAMEKKIVSDEGGQRALFNTSVLEYVGRQGNERWHYVNPLVIPNRFFQEALNSSSQVGWVRRPSSPA